MDRYWLKVAGLISTAIATIIVLVVLMALLTGCFDPRVNDFYAECEALGGFVTETQPAGLFSAGRIDCIKDNQIIYLDGFN